MFPLTMFTSECSPKIVTRSKNIEVEKPITDEFFVTYTCDICDYVCGRKKELDKHMQETHDFKYPWKVLSQVSLRLRDWSPRILKANYEVKFRNDKVVSKDCVILDKEASTLKTEHQPRMLKYFSINRTATTNNRMDKRSTGQEKESTLVGSLKKKYSSKPTLNGCLVKGDIKKTKMKKKKEVTFKEEGSLCEVTYFRQNTDDPFRGNKCNECDFICASSDVLGWHMRSTHNEAQQFQTNLNEDLWETMILTMSVIVAVLITLYISCLLPAIE